MQNLYNEDAFFANRPFKPNAPKPSQFKAKFVSNATNLLNQPSMTQNPHDYQHSTNISQPKHYEEPRLQLYKPTLVPAMPGRTNSIDIPVSDTRGSLTNQVSNRFQTNQFSYLASKYSLPYDYSAAQQVGQEMSSRLNSIQGQNTFLAIKPAVDFSHYQRRDREASLHQQQRIEQTFDQRKKLSEEQDFYRQHSEKKLGTGTFNNVIHKNHQSNIPQQLDYSYEKLLPSDILD